VAFFDFLRKSAPPPSGSPAVPVDKRVASLARVAGDKRQQTYDRIEALQQLVDIKSPAAAAALLKRFTFSIDPSITDQEEKDLAFQGIVAAGPGAVDAVIDFCVKAEQLTWPLKILRELLDDDAYRDELIELLSRFDTEYSRNVDPKVQVLQALEEVVSDEVRETIEPFLDDVNETVRFHAVETTFAQGNAASVAPLIKLLTKEESVRVKNKVAEGLLLRAWIVPSELRDATAEALRDASGYYVDREGRVHRGPGDRS
jgi:HEAT repeat protein